MHRNFKSVVIIFLIMLFALGIAKNIYPNNPDKDVPAGYSSKVAFEPEKYNGFGVSGGIKVVDINKPEFKKMVQVFCTNRRKNFWDAGAGYPNVLAEDVKKDGAMLFTFWARVIETKNETERGIFHVSVNKKRGGWSEKSLASDLSVSREWQQFFLPFKCREDYTNGQLGMAFECGFDAQIIQFGGIAMYYYGNKVPFEKLPKTRQSYAGIELDAPWRADAEKRIRKHRMADYAIKVVDKNGKSVENAKVRLKMVRHAYEFGTACTPGQLLETEFENYRKKFLELFNAGTFFNALKWQPIAGDWGRGFNVNQTIRALKWAKTNNIRFRGHVMVWPGWRNMPNYMKNKYKDKPNADCEAMKKDILAYIEKVSSLTKEYLIEWDVINEPYDNGALMDLCGREMMADWFKVARKHLPDAGLALNDYGLITITDSPHQDHYIETAKFLLDQGAPITVLGLQGHFGGMVPSPERVLLVLDRFAKLNLPMRITEYTTAGDDKEFQADYLRDFLTVYFSHPSTIGFQAWGRLIGDNGEDNHLTPAFRALVKEKWWTDEKLVTDKDGTVSSRGFLGEYRVIVRYNDMTVIADYVLSKTSGEFTVRLEE